MLLHWNRAHRQQVATDALTDMERAMARDNIVVNDRQLACARINSREGQDYLVRLTQSPTHGAARSYMHAFIIQAAMACAANYAWVNRSSMTFLCRQVRRFAATPSLPPAHF